MPVLVYIICDINLNYYCGITNNLERRLKEHNSQKKGYTKFSNTWKVVFSESWPDRKTAARRERKIKNFGPKKFFTKYKISS